MGVVDDMDRSGINLIENEMMYSPKRAFVSIINKLHEMNPYKGDIIIPIMANTPEWHTIIVNCNDILQHKYKYTSASPNEMVIGYNDIKTQNLPALLPNELVCELLHTLLNHTEHVRFGNRVMLFVSTETEGFDSDTFLEYANKFEIQTAVDSVRKDSDVSRIKDNIERYILERSFVEIMSSLRNITPYLKSDIVIPLMTEDDNTIIVRGHGVERYVYTSASIMDIVTRYNYIHRSVVTRLTPFIIAEILYTLTSHIDHVYFQCGISDLRQVIEIEEVELDEFENYIHSFDLDTIISKVRAESKGNIMQHIAELIQPFDFSKCERV